MAKFSTYNCISCSLLNLVYCSMFVSFNAIIIKFKKYISTCAMIFFIETEINKIIMFRKINSHYHKQH